ncbi:MAG: HD domain-containing protein [Lachnospiraceae bacterium]|nr:HD domain-containing protein [Lachnospiraceae bacterium]
MKRSFRLSDDELKDFMQYAKPVAGDNRVRRMRGFIQHGATTTYAHSLSVAYTAFLINRRLGIKTDEKSLIKAALLHDYFLYDWHDHGDRLHGYHHPDIAGMNARRDFDITDKEYDMIASHMWPLTLFHIPRSKEGWILTLADKICSSKEVIRSTVPSAED